MRSTTSGSLRRQGRQALIVSGERKGGRAWRDLRAKVLAGDPWCAICRNRPATTVDHIVPVTLGGAEMDLGNCRPACGPCNYAGGARITNARRAGRVPTQRSAPSHQDIPCTYTPGDRLPCSVACGGALAPYACRLPDSYWSRT